MGGDWVTTDKTGPDLPYDTLPPPVQVQPAGQRFAVDEEQQYVEWGDFSFYITFTRDTGMRLFNIKYKNDTILYELGLQEAIAHYAGNDPVQSGIGYLDSYYGKSESVRGEHTKRLITGIGQDLGRTHSTWSRGWTVQLTRIIFLQHGMLANSPRRIRRPFASLSPIWATLSNVIRPPNMSLPRRT